MKTLPYSKILFCGTPSSALPSLRLLARHTPSLTVLTPPDAPSGRGHTLTPCPVALEAKSLSLPLLQPLSVRTPDFLSTLRSLTPDLVVVVAYREILPLNFLSTPRHGCINLHFSLLPRWRGASPVQHALLAGDSTTGVTIQQIIPLLDAGPILSQSTLPLTPQDTTATLLPRLASLGADLLLQTLSQPFQPRIQDNSLATHCSKIKKSDGLIDFTALSALQIDRRRRAFDPWPGIFTTFNSTRLKLLQTTPLSSSNLSPGQTAQDPSTSSLLIGTTSGDLSVSRLLLAGKKPLSAPDFLRGYPQILKTTLPS